jgi:CheY-like chemotaxis protein
LARKILLADDSVTAQNMGRKILSDAGYEVVTVNNGSAALKKVAELKPDLVVLDVYMPGYSGLEVCQRLKENRDTARIPILLTVGKLEPFKPEEARRVKADAYVVKPFEASELLTALTRLEDKIVPQATTESEKPGRFAKAIAAFEGGEKFGDAESGWKDRLRFPTGEKKREPETETENPAPAANAQRDSTRHDEPSAATERTEFERPIPSGLPADITPEEIAAITAAAAQLSGKAVATSQPEPEPPAAVPAAIEESAVSQTEVSLASEQVASAEEEAAPVTLASAPAEVVATAQETSAVEATDATSAEATTEIQQPAADAQSEEKPAQPAADADVMAALESLGPSNGNGSAHLDAPSSQPTDGIASASVLAEIAKMESAQAGVAHWIAEPVAVDVEESAASLESEMHKAFAAFAAADAARMAFPATAALVGSYVVSPRAETSSVAIAEPEANAAGQVADESAPGLDVQAASAQAEPSLPVSSEASNTKDGETEDKDSHTDALRAAVWANWNQIRESIVGVPSGQQQATEAQPSPVVASGESATEKDLGERADSKKDSGAKAEDFDAMAAAASAGSASTSSASTSAAEAGTIANIVESVLAELRPKIMEEITRKLNNEKNK